jgi:ABC-2 type transport system permease protein
VLHPLLNAIVMTIVFSTLFRRSIPNFIVYLLCGQLLYHYNSESTNLALHSITKNSGIIRKIYIPKYMFVISDLSVAFMNLVFSFLPLIFIAIYTGAKITWLWLFIPVLLLMQTMFSLGLSLILAAYGVFFRDLTHLYGIMLTVGHYLCAIFYPISIVPEKYLFLWRLNPIYNYISILRDIIHAATMPSLESIVIGAIYGVLTLGMGCAIFSENQEKFFLHI